MIVIPAKYSSTRTPRKNFRLFYNGLSLLQIAIIRSVSAQRGPVVVSSENTQEVLIQLANLPEHIKSAVTIHERPPHLAKDPATILDVLANYLSSLAANPPEAISVVLPTSPFNSVSSINEAWEAFNASEAPKLLSVSQADKPPFNAWVSSENSLSNEIQLAFPDNPYRLTQSTACPKAFFSNGCISIYSVEILMANRNFQPILGFEMPQIASMDIDYEIEFELAQLAFSKWADDLILLNN